MATGRDVNSCILEMNFFHDCGLDATTKLVENLHPSISALYSVALWKAVVASDFLTRYERDFSIYHRRNFWISRNLADGSVGDHRETGCDCDYDFDYDVGCGFYFGLNLAMCHSNGAAMFQVAQVLYWLRGLFLPLRKVDCARRFSLD